MLERGCICAQVHEIWDSYRDYLSSEEEEAMPKYLLDAETMVRIQAIHELFKESFGKTRPVDVFYRKELNVYLRLMEEVIVNRKQDFEACLGLAEEDDKLLPVLNLKEDYDKAQSLLGKINDGLKPELNKILDTNRTAGNYTIQSIQYAPNRYMLESEFHKMVNDVAYVNDAEYKEFILDESKKRDEEINHIHTVANIKGDAMREVHNDSRYLDGQKIHDEEIATLKQQLEKQKKAEGVTKEVVEKFEKFAREESLKIEEQFASLTTGIFQEKYNVLAEDRLKKENEVRDRYQKAASEKFAEIDEKVKNIFEKKQNEYMKEAIAEEKEAALNFENKYLNAKIQELHEKGLAFTEEDLNATFVEEDIENMVFDDPDSKPKEESKPEQKSQELNNSIDDDQMYIDNPNLINPRDVRIIPNEIGEFRNYLNAEKVAKEAGFNAAKENFRVLKNGHIEKINAIHKILRTNKKFGLSGNSTEYKEVLSALDDYQKCLTTTDASVAWDMANKSHGFGDNEAVNGQILMDKLDIVYQKTAAYMAIKGPEKKFWAHGEGRYDLMYLLCDEIYPGGGHAAELNSCISKVDKEIQKGMREASQFDHQIPTPSKSETVWNKYKDKINEVMVGEPLDKSNPNKKRKIGTNEEIRTKIDQFYDQSSSNQSNIIQPKNSMIQM